MTENYTLNACEAQTMYDFTRLQVSGHTDEAQETLFYIKLYIKSQKKT